jgi:exodeoxyribonuclease V gamma subunit
MFVLHSSNKTENLVAHLAAVITSLPLSSPFQKEVFLIQSQGMERWLSQQLAGHFKVWGNYQFLFPNKFFSAMALKIDSRLDDSTFERDVMLWRIESLLRKHSWQLKREQTPGGEDEFLHLKHYLSGENIPLKRYQLARQLAQIFDQYQLMRPDMLDEWQLNRMLYKTKTEVWQKALWLEIIKITGTKHRGALWMEMIAKLNATEDGGFNGLLPERISVFGLNTMPPIFLSYLQGLAKHCQVHLFLLNPAQSFWADLANKRKFVGGEILAGHPLLSMFGQQGREFQEMILEQTQFDFEPESFEAETTPNNLQRLQNDILNNCPEGLALQNDGSISIHACHSRMREVEVLRNQLLQNLEGDEKLELRDIVVMAPDIQVYEPYISAVFNDIQHAIADRSLRLSNSSLDAFIRFLNLSQSRFGWRSVLDLLEQTVVYPAFGLAETDLELIKHWMQETHVRWGKSARHMQELELPEINANTWQAMLDRLLMGYAVSNDKDFVDEVLPYQNIEGSSAGALGGLCAFMQLVFDAGNDLKQALTLKPWSLKLHDYAGRLLGSKDSNEHQQLNELFAELAAVPFSENDVEPHQNIELQVIIAWLEDRVSERKSSKGFLRGQLTFCSMLPMRSIPAKVIALLGMNDGEFPKIDRTPTFDLLAHNFRKGDRSRRADDRYQFLEVLLSARQHLIITYIGQSISNNAAIPPSVVISELLEVLRDSYQLSDLIIRHPLQSFSPRYFEELPELFSFSEADCEIAKAISTPKPEATCWWQGEISSDAATEIESKRVIELSELFSFFQHPQRYFMRRQLDVRFSGIEEEPEEREPFALDRLDGYSIHHEWIGEILVGSSFSVKKLQAQGRWLPGSLGELEFERQRKTIENFVDRIKEKNLGQPLDNLTIDITINHYRLIGKLGNRYENGSLFYRFAELKGKDFLSAWLHHLIINQLHQQPTYLMSTDDDLLMRSDYCQPDYLSELISIYLQGLQTPNAFFIEPALAYVKQVCNLKKGGLATKSALQAAVDKLAHAVLQSYEPELNRLYGNTADIEGVLGDSFEQQCQTLLLPVWEAMHGT